jgi:hypothetical protein
MTYDPHICDHFHARFVLKTPYVHGSHLQPHAMNGMCNHKAKAHYMDED